MPTDNRTTRNARRSLRRMVQHYRGWGVRIKREDGTSFMACGSQGNVTPAWVHHNKTYALRWADELEREGFDAEVVPVEFTYPTALNAPHEPCGESRQ